MLKSIQRLVALLLTGVVLSAPLAAQQKRQNPPRKPAPAEVAEPVPTFDSLLAADSYKVYSEVRNVGALIHSPALDELLDPLMKLVGPAKEFETLRKWLKTHADALVGSRMMAASWPSRPSLPFVLMAIEFSSPEEAKKFFPELRDFIPKLVAKPASAESTVVVANPMRVDVARTTSEPETVQPTPRQVPSSGDNPTAPAPPPFHLRQVGSLVLISPTPVELRELRPRGSLPLEEDQNFNLARNRFASEPLFVFVDLKSIEKEEKTQREKWENEERKRVEAEAANPPPPPKVEPTPDPELMTNIPSPEEPSPTLGSAPPPAMPAADLPRPDTSSTATLSGGPPEDVGPVFPSLGLLLSGGQTKWPEALGASLVIEGDAYIVRTLIVNNTENKNNAVPFLPFLVPGPAIVPAAASVFPANTDLFVSASLDYSQIYEEMLKAVANADAMARRYSRAMPARAGQPPESPFAYYEKKLGLKIKDDLLPLLGNEIALALPRRKAEAATDQKTPPKPVRPPEPIPVLAIAVKDREAVKRLIPKIIQALGFKGAELIAQTERKESTEITSYAGYFAYAFVDDFLVLSPDATETRRVVDAYLSHQTLASDTTFKNFTRWQSRQVLGQVYIAPSVVEQYTTGAFRGPAAGDNFAELLTRVSPVIDPMTYSLLNDGVGPLHELHVPKNLVQLIAAGVGASQAKPTPLQANEGMARNTLYSIVYSQQDFKTTNGNYATLDQLISKSFVNKEMVENHGYSFLVSVSGNAFEAVAVPIEYGRTGRLSFFIDESGILRGGDHGGGAATASDDPVNY